MQALEAEVIQLKELAGNITTDDSGVEVTLDLETAKLVGIIA